MSTNHFSTFVSALDIPVVDRCGHPAGFDRQGQPITRVMANPPISYLFPDEPVALINWLWEQRADYRLAPTELDKPVQYAKKTYHGQWAWGSAVKRGITIGLTRDLLRET